MHCTALLHSSCSLYTNYGAGLACSLLVHACMQAGKGLLSPGNQGSCFDGSRAHSICAFDFLSSGPTPVSDQMNKKQVQPGTEVGR